MIQHIKSAERYHADHGWLSTWQHFSFNDYLTQWPVDDTRRP